jgi:hypothetical protein
LSLRASLPEVELIQELSSLTLSITPSPSEII